MASLSILKWGDASHWEASRRTCTWSLHHHISGLSLLGPALFLSWIMVGGDIQVPRGRETTALLVLEAVSWQPPRAPISWRGGGTEKTASSLLPLPWLSLPSSLLLTMMYSLTERRESGWVGSGSLIWEKLLCLSFGKERKHPALLFFC